MRPLYPELASIGLELNVTKTKILTNARLETQCFVGVAGEFVEIMHGGQTHKCLGRTLVMIWLCGQMQNLIIGFELLGRSFTSTRASF